MSKLHSTRASGPPDNRLMWELSQSKVCVPALVAADRLGYFRALEQRALSRAELARATATTERAADILVDFLLPSGMLLESVGRQLSLSLSPVGRAFMLPSSRYYFGPFLERVAGVTITPDALVRAARGGKSSVYAEQDMWERHRQSSSDAAGFAHAAHCRALWTATRLAEAGLLDGCTELLDAGGGLGTYSAEFVRASRGLHATLLDLEPVCALARAYLETEGLADRVTVRATDIFAEPWPAQQHAVWLSEVLHDWSTPEILQLLQRAFACLEPGGRVFLNELLLNETGGGPIASSEYGVAMLFTTRGRQYRFSELDRYLAQAGFVGSSIAERCGVHSVVVATKPGG